MTLAMREMTLTTRFPETEVNQGSADVDALVDVIMNVQRLAMDLAGDVRELDINPLVVRPRGAVALDALVVRT